MPFLAAPHIERVDCLVRRIAASGFECKALDEIVALVDERLARNRVAGSAKGQ